MYATSTVHFLNIFQPPDQIWSVWGDSRSLGELKSAMMMAPNVAWKFSYDFISPGRFPVLLSNIIIIPKRGNNGMCLSVKFYLKPAQTIALDLKIIIFLKKYWICRPVFTTSIVHLSIVCKMNQKLHIIGVSKLGWPRDGPKRHSKYHRNASCTLMTCFRGTHITSMWNRFLVTFLLISDSVLLSVRLLLLLRYLRFGLGAEKTWKMNSTRRVQNPRY